MWCGSRVDAMLLELRNGALFHDCFSVTVSRVSFCPPSESLTASPSILSIRGFSFGFFHAWSLAWNFIYKVRGIRKDDQCLAWS